jgi:hypothetical protein
MRGGGDLLRPHSCANRRWGGGERRPSALGSAAALALILALPGACEIAVSDTVPSFACVPGPDSCPTGSVCAPATSQCVPGSRACTTNPCPAGERCDLGSLACVSLDGAPGDASILEEGVVDAPATSPEGAPPEGSSTCSALGCKCSGASDCASRMCGDELTLTSDIYKAAGNASVCTRACCTSLDCDPGTVCFGTAAGGNYCIRPDWLGRSVLLGSMAGGAPCSTGSDCRSGLCSGTACADTCCSTQLSALECTPGAVCGYANFPGVAFDVHYAAFCASGRGAGPNQSACSSNAQCASNLCPIDGRCHSACRSSADCGDATQHCAYAIPNLAAPAIVAVCSAASGTGAEGASCQGNGDCASGFCDLTPHQCTDVCFGDGDCHFAGWRCRPGVVALPGGGSYSVLACGS